VSSEFTRQLPDPSARSRGQGGAPAAGSRPVAGGVRTHGLDAGEDRGGVVGRVGVVDPVAKSRIRGCQPCRAALPFEGPGSRAPVAVAAPTPIRPVGRMRAGLAGCQPATMVR
jgi:hypothetical protein